MDGGEPMSWPPFFVPDGVSGLLAEAPAGI